MQTSVGDLRRILQEALKKSDAENVAASLERAAGRINGRVGATADFSGQMLNVFVRHVAGDADAIEAALIADADKNGWSLLSRSDRNGRLVWWFEPKAETKGPLSKKNLPAIMWHGTPRENLESILATGLRPSHRLVPGTTRRYSGRVYLATSRKGAEATSKSGDEWAMMTIDITKLPKSMKFYVDQEFGHSKDGTPVAVYVLEPIPAEAISEV